MYRLMKVLLISVVLIDFGLIFFVVSQAVFWIIVAHVCCVLIYAGLIKEQYPSLSRFDRYFLILNGVVFWGGGMLGNYILIRRLNVAISGSSLVFDYQPIVMHSTPDLDIGLSVDLSIHSHFDTLMGDNVTKKKILLSNILNQKKYQWISKAQIAIQDSNYEVRTLASVVLSNLEKSLMGKISELKGALELSPSSFFLKQRLIYYYGLYMDSGLLTHQSMAGYFNVAHQLLTQMESSSDQCHVIRQLKLMKMRLNVIQFHPDDGVKVRFYRKVLVKYPHQKQAFRLLSSILFKTRRLKELRLISKRFNYVAPQILKNVDAISLWANA